MKVANEAYSNKNYAKAMELWKKSAENGNAEAMCYVGELYRDGEGVTQNYTKAMEWLKKSAENGEARAMNSIGNMYYEGSGTTKDYVKAMEWYRKAAEKGDAEAMYNIAYLYYEGLGTTKDYVKAKEWFQKAAENGYEDAEEALEEVNKLIAQRNASSASSQNSNLIWLTKADFLKKVCNCENLNDWNYLGNKPAIVVFVPAATWCKPCEKIKSDFTELVAEYNNQFLLYMVDTEGKNENELIRSFKDKAFIVPATLYIPLKGKPNIVEAYTSKDDLKKNINEYVLKNTTGSSTSSAGSQTSVDKSSELVGTKWAKISKIKAFGFDGLEEEGFEFLSNKKVKYCKFKTFEIDDERFKDAQGTCHCYIGAYTFDGTRGKVEIDVTGNTLHKTAEELLNVFFQDRIKNGFKIDGNKLKWIKDDTDTFNKVSSYKYIKCK